MGLPRVILICEATSHACEITRDDLVRYIGSRWSDIDRTLAIMQGQDPDNPTPGMFYGIPFDGPMGRMTVHVQGRMDIQEKRFQEPCPHCGTFGKGCSHRKALVWKPKSHKCTPMCMFADDKLHPHTEQSIFGY